MFKAILLLSFVLSFLVSAILVPDAHGGKRGKVIDFEDEVVEGMNRKPLDSVSQVSEKDRRHKRPHLYRKRAGFRSETDDTIRTLRATP
ncbi:MAG: hypothetical protein ACXWPM_01285 [Bdellovibrionota bacterium]